MKEFKNVCEAYYWVMKHPKMRGATRLEPWTEFTPHMVNPETEEIDDDTSKNTELEWWVEGGSHFLDDETGRIMSEHDWDLDTGGKTAEEATFNFAKKVYKKHGDYS